MSLVELRHSSGCCAPVQREFIQRQAVRTACDPAEWFCQVRVTFGTPINCGLPTPAVQASTPARM